jgi:predicted DNA-binding protein
LVKNNIVKITRPHRITVRLSDEEYQRLEARAKLIGQTPVDVIRQLINKNKLSQPIMSHEDLLTLVLAIKDLQQQISQNSDMQTTETYEALDGIWSCLEKAVNRIT